MQFNQVGKCLLYMKSLDKTKHNMTIHTDRIKEKILKKHRAHLIISPDQHIPSSH
jgi:hypothetical protein